MSAQEYKIDDKVFFGTDYPFARVKESVDGLLNINSLVEGTRLPRVSKDFMERITTSDPFATWWKGETHFATEPQPWAAPLRSGG